MGTICEPNYANIFMEKFEKNVHLSIQKFIFKLYCRFICDIFVLWIEAAIQLEEFIKK